MDKETREDAIKQYEKKTKNITGQIATLMNWLKLHREDFYQAPNYAYVGDLSRISSDLKDIIEPFELNNPGE